MEEFNLSDLTLDEAAEARISHADFLNQVKNWGMEMGVLIQGYTHIANILLQDDVSSDDVDKVSLVFPIGLKLTIEHLNEFYNMIQNEAKKVLGSPFALHEAHSEHCDGTQEFCGHQDHWA
jgi:hypothetical protein